VTTFKDSSTSLFYLFVQKSTFSFLQHDKNLRSYISFEIFTDKRIYIENLFSDFCTDYLWIVYTRVRFFTVW